MHMHMHMHAYIDLCLIKFEDLLGGFTRFDGTLYCGGKQRSN